MHHTKSAKVRRVPLRAEVHGEVRLRIGRLVPYSSLSLGSFAKTALGTGLRWRELCRAQAADVKRLQLPGNVGEQWVLEVSQTKSRKARRVPLSPELVREVRSRVGRLVPYAVVSPGSFAKAVRLQTGIEAFHVHKTRHTFACQWLERGGSLPSLQQMLGHASIVTTQRYARLTDEAVVREALRIERERSG